MFVLTLVHGTWGRGVFCPSGDAPWTSGSSELRTSLRDRLGSELVFRRFRWSGVNSHTARFQAAHRLRNYLRKGVKRWPKATHLVIAHSHGGNVVLSAIEASDLEEHIAGIACLGTPFISARPRDLGPNPLRIFSAALLVLVMSFLWLTDNVVLASWPNLARLGFVAVVGSLLMSVLLILVIAARKHSNKLCQELTPRLPKTDRLLIIRSPADEASGALAVFQFISQITVRLFLLAQSWYSRVEVLVTSWTSHKRKVLVVGLGAFVLCYVFLIGYAEWSKPEYPTLLANAALVGGAISLLVFTGAIFLVLPFIGAEGVTLPFRLVTSALLWPVIGVLSILLIAPFGWQAAVANLFLDVTVDTTPVGSWEIHLVNPPTSEELGVPVPPLMHKVYENPQALRKLGEWISERAEQHPE